MKKIARPVFFNFYADGAKLAELRRLCKKNGVSMSEVLRLAMNLAIKAMIVGGRK